MFQKVIDLVQAHQDGFISEEELVAKLGLVYLDHFDTLGLTTPMVERRAE